jgi:hypothetical protein
LARPPYARRPDRDTRNPSDEIFAHEGNETVLTVVPDGDGYQASICLQVAALGADGAHGIARRLPSSDGASS